ncbi:hypothetical protein HBZS_119280 [Helicobacter bizzozeronii CCUG 35545]|nr:hypothetical protein HBZS_119280 [Helicobacter bizzozeronii CCUG 35545]
MVSTNRLNILDCQSFAVLESQKLDTSKVRRTSAPFFSRVEGVDRGTLGKVLSGGKSKNYFGFYDNLLKKEAQKRLERAVKAEQRREYEMEMREAKSAQKKEKLEGTIQRGEKRGQRKYYAQTLQTRKG